MADASGAVAAAARAAGMSAAGWIPPPAAELVDLFDTKDTARWTWGALNEVVGGQALLHSNGNNSYLTSTQRWCLTGSSLVFEVPQVMTAPPGYSTSCVTLSDPTGDTTIKIIAADGWLQGFSTSFTYSATNHRWWRLRENNGTSYFDTSPNGATWTQKVSANTSSTNTDAMLVIFWCYTVAGKETKPFTIAAINPGATAGTAAPALQQPTASLSGAQSQSGSAAPALRKPTTTLSGNQLFTGTAGPSLTRPESSLLGSDLKIGAVHTTAQPAAANLSGMSATAGPLAAAVTPPSAAITADTPPSGFVTAAGAPACAVFTGWDSKPITRVGADTTLGDTITIPAHAAGDLILMFAYRAGVSWPYPDLPDGWIDLDTGGSGWNCDRVAYRIATTAGTASGTWAGATGLAVAVYRSAGRWRCPRVADNGNAWAASTMVWPDLPARPGGAWFVRFAGNRLATNLDTTTPVGWTDVSSSPTRVRVIDTGAVVLTSASEVGENAQTVNAATSWRTVTVSLADTTDPVGAALDVWNKIPTTASVATLAGLCFNLYNDMPAKFQGLFQQNTYTLERIRYPASLAANSITTGVEMLNDWVRATPGPKIILGQSQGAQVCSRWMDQYAADPTAPAAADLTFILSGNPCSSQRGAAAATSAAEVDGLTAQFTRTDTPWPIVDVHIRWDGWADWPDDETNRRAVANADRGKASRHKRYGDVDLYDPSHTVWTVGNTTHILTAPMTFGLPYYDTHATPDCVITAAIAAIEAAYDRPAGDTIVPIVQPVNKFERGLMTKAGLSTYITG